MGDFLFVIVEVATQLPLQARAASGDVRKDGGSCSGRDMPSPPTLRESGLPAEVSEIPAKTTIGRRS